MIMRILKNLQNSRTGLLWFLGREPEIRALW